jgi:hypothetical protein
MVTILMQRRLQHAASILYHQFSVLGPMNSQFIGRARHSSSEEMAGRVLKSFILGLESKALSDSFLACVLVKPKNWEERKSELN